MEEFIEDFFHLKNPELKNIHVKIYSKDRSKFSQCEVIHKSTFWKIRFAAGDNRIAFITYNCNEKDKNNEIDEINKIFDSFLLS